MCDELVYEANIVCRALRNYGFEPLDPIIGEKITNEHKLLEQMSESTLNKNWKRDKQMLQESHLVLDYNSCNKSDGVSVELGYARFFMWKPVIRVFPNLGISISKLEFDTVVSNICYALPLMTALWGTKKKLLIWRLKMLIRCIPKFVLLQIKFLTDLL